MIGRELKILRVRAGLTQTQAAERIGVVQASICRWETGQQRVPEKRLWQLTKLYQEEIKNA